MSRTRAENALAPSSLEEVLLDGERHPAVLAHEVVRTGEDLRRDVAEPERGDRDHRVRLASLGNDVDAREPVHAARVQHLADHAVARAEVEDVQGVRALPGRLGT